MKLQICSFESSVLLLAARRVALWREARFAVKLNRFSLVKKEKKRKENRKMRLLLVLLLDYFGVLPTVCLLCSIMLFFVAYI